MNEREQYLSTAEAAAKYGWTQQQLSLFLSRHAVRRYVRVSDIDVAKAAAGVQGKAATQCSVKGKEHWWDPKTWETDEPSGEPLVWCGRKGCGVGVVRVPQETGQPQVVYRHRPV